MNKWKSIALMKGYFWEILAVVSVIIRWIVGYFPEAVEQLYSRGLFLGMRLGWDYTVAAVPVPLFYVFWLVLIVWIFRFLRGMVRQSASISISHKLLRLGRGAVRLVAIVVVYFLWSWGFNYARVPIAEQLDLDLQPLDLERIKKEVQWATKKTLDLRSAIPDVDTHAISTILNTQDTLYITMNKLALETHIRHNLEGVLAELGYPTEGKVRVRALRPDGILLRLKTSGVYWFFVGEGNMDAGLHPLQHPFTMAHEMTHGYGIGDEGTCNFIAYLTCLRSQNASVRYSGMLTYWRYIAREYLRRAPDEYATFRAAHLSVGMKNDLQAIYNNQDKYRDILPQVRDASYNAYLKLQGVEDGLESYSRIVLLVDAWKRK